MLSVQWNNTQPSAENFNALSIQYFWGLLLLARNILKKLNYLENNSKKHNNDSCADKQVFLFHFVVIQKYNQSKSNCST